jgi:hypothetical protein
MEGKIAVGFAANFSFRSSYSYDLTPPAEEEEKGFYNEGLILFHSFSRVCKI